MGAHGVTNKDSPAKRAPGLCAGDPLPDFVQWVMGW